MHVNVCIYYYRCFSSWNLVFWYCWLCGVWVSARANVRVSSAARRSAREALQISVRAGGFSALVVVGMAVIGIGILYAIVYVWLGVNSPGTMKATDLPLLVGYGFGASFVALFAQLGGGIYTKADDVETDLVAKVEKGIPKDNPRNPAVIADLVQNLPRVTSLSSACTGECCSHVCEALIFSDINY